MFRAALANPISADETARIVRNIIESATWQLRHPSGADAGAFLGWRAGMNDEQWINWSAQEDDAWYDQVQREFGLNARQYVKGAGAADRS